MKRDEVEAFAIGHGGNVNHPPLPSEPPPAGFKISGGTGNVMRGCTAINSEGPGLHVENSEVTGENNTFIINRGPAISAKNSIIDLKGTKARRKKK